MKSFILNLSKKSGKILLKHYGKVKFIKVKDKKSYVTNADLESEKFIISSIRRKFPKHNIISEESGNLKKKSEYTWYIDPLDGTHNYINKLPMFGVSIALAYKEKVKFGTINLPYFNEFYFAERHKGAYLNGRKIKVSDKKTLKRAFVVTDLAFRYFPEEKLRLLKKLRNHVYDIRVLGSAAYSYSLVAKGSVDAYITLYTYPWDVAAGALIVQEANGKVTDIGGNKWKFEQQKFVSSNGKIHNQLLKIL